MFEETLKVSFWSNIEFDKSSKHSKGVISIEKNGVRFPLSLTGGRILDDGFQADSFDSVANGPEQAPSAVQQSTCYAGSPPSSYIAQLLVHRPEAFLVSVEESFNSLSPYWFKIAIQFDVGSIRSWEMKAELVKGKSVLAQPTPCTAKLPIRRDSLYYVYQTYQELKLLFPGETETLPFGETKCVVLDLTEGSVFLKANFKGDGGMISRYLFQSQPLAGT